MQAVVTGTMRSGKVRGIEWYFYHIIHAMFEHGVISVRVSCFSEESDFISTLSTGQLH